MLDTSYVYTRGTNLNFPPISIRLRRLADCVRFRVHQFLSTAAIPTPYSTAFRRNIYDGYSNYNALQLRLQKRMSYGLSFQLNYAWSKSLDTGTGNGHGSGIDIYQNAYTPSPNYGLSDFNATNTLVGQIAYELPFGRGRQFATARTG